MDQEGPSQYHKESDDQGHQQDDKDHIGAQLLDQLLHGSLHIHIGIDRRNIIEGHQSDKSQWEDEILPQSPASLIPLFYIHRSSIIFVFQALDGWYRSSPPMTSKGLSKLLVYRLPVPRPCGMTGSRV